MTRPATEAWLADFQRRFGEVLRTPLDAHSGSLRAQPDRYAPQLLAAVSGRASERLAVYNRQYWFRLLTVMQGSWPLTARLVGLFHFNLHAQRFLLQTPPAHYDLRVVTLGFAAYLADNLQDRGALSKRAVLEAAELDAAFARVFHAPAQPRFDLSRCAPETLVQRRLVSSAAYTRVEEHWPLAELRVALRDDTSELAVPLPPPLPAAQTWAIFRNDQGTVQLRLAPLHARLLALLEAAPFGEALAQLEAEANAEARENLPQQTQAWVAQGVACGFWVGVA